MKFQKIFSVQEDWSSQLNDWLLQSQIQRFILIVEPIIKEDKQKLMKFFHSVVLPEFHRQLQHAYGNQLIQQQSVKNYLKAGFAGWKTDAAWNRWKRRLMLESRPKDFQDWLMLESELADLKHPPELLSLSDLSYNQMKEFTKKVKDHYFELFHVTL